MYSVKNHPLPSRTVVSLGDLVEALYEEYLSVYGDPELAEIAAAATVNDLLITELSPDSVEAA
jgi:hypothetical protein